MQEFFETLYGLVQKVESAPTGHKKFTLAESARKALVAVNTSLPLRPAWMSDLSYMALRNSMRSLTLNVLVDSAIDGGLTENESYDTVSAELNAMNAGKQ